MKPQPHSNSSLLTVLHDTKEWETRIDGDIKGVQVNGQKLNDIHDLAQKIDRMTTIIKTLAVVATILAIFAVGGTTYIGSWLALNHEKIERSMNTTEHRFSEKNNLLQNQSRAYATKLTELGWTWKDGKWQTIGNTAPQPSK